MNYVDINLEGVQSLYLNVNVDENLISGEIGVFTIYKDGSSTAIASFNPFTDSFATIASKGYYQDLSVNFNEITYTTPLEDETQYLLESVLYGKVVYRGKFQTTSKSLDAYSVNEGKYAEKITNNNYTILE